MLDATAHFEAIHERLPGGAKVLQARKAALARAEQTGLPTRRNENWHYTDLARLLKHNDAVPVRANAFDANALSPLQMVFENGVLINEPAGDDCVSIESLAHALASGARNHEDDASDHDMAAFNLALAQDGAVMTIDGTPARALELVTRGDETAHLRHAIKVERGTVTLIENLQANGYTNAVLDVEVAAGARVLLVRVQSVGHHVGLTRVKLNGDGAFCAVTFVTGGNLARHETHIRLLGEGARADVHGAILGHGTMHADMTSQLHHETANTDSLTTLHAVLDDAAQGVFQGKVVVARDAQHVDAQQQSRAMMLSERA
ncbi:MAG: SufD family Fe-S cluster assembly protein, partial [Pseudomonadota bacterium]|nr:SufD family Fe-S cluster assembly protein [Pseudomonadota bacterium]